MSSELDFKAERPDLRVVATSQPSRDEIGIRIRVLLSALTDLHMQDAELRQLWLETQWLKSDYDQNVLSMPTNWELIIIQVARGQVSHTLRRYPEVVEAAANLGNAIKNHLTAQFGN